MKTLWLLRHAKSSWSDSTLEDHERPLNDRGHRGALAVGKFIKKNKISPELILCSTATRAQQTLEIIVDVSGFSNEVQNLNSLYLCSTQGLIDHVTSLAESLSSVMMIGHNPGMESFLTHLSGVEKHMPTAALAEIKVESESWQDVQKRNSARLQWLITPKDLQEK
ncbi:MAG TPA: histidine phosphatase family protein [Pyrinomonadaceae bacterium]|nr:histidine phosphatase family protein [Pyrinomonadaceae bacterium]